MEKITNVVETSGVSRRRFLGYAGALAGAGMLTLQACNKDDEGNPPTPTDDTVNLGSADTGVLNYAYALEQLEAAFYIEVINRMGTGMFSADEINRLTEIRDHEVAHREFFKKALGGSAIRDLEPNFSNGTYTVDFASRASVLATAKTFEDLGVSAYNGAGKLLVDVNYLLVAGKIVSVEARHAAYLRELVSAGSFATADVVNAQGLELSRMPLEVLPMAQPYIKQKLNGNNLPTS